MAWQPGSVETIVGSGAPDRASDAEFDGGGVVINPHSPLGKELAKWEQHHTYFVGRGMRPGNPFKFRMYPYMVYKAQQWNGGWKCLLPPPELAIFPTVQEAERWMLAVETHNRSCYKLVHDETEHERARSEGWMNSQKEALEHRDQLEQEMAQAAAEANAAAIRMTSRAQAEFAEAGEQTHEHVTDVVPTKKRGRPAKGVQAVTGHGEVDNG